MKPISFSEYNDQELIKFALDETLGFNRARAIEALANRALINSGLLEAACKAISSDRHIGFHSGPPLGWFGADQIFLSEQKLAINALLEEMNTWEPTEQEDLVRHWAGRRGLVELTKELGTSYDWIPRYNF
jgi:hypothetical protein